MSKEEVTLYVVTPKELAIGAAIRAAIVSAMVGVGVLIGSTVLQWIGGLIAMFVIGIYALASTQTLKHSPQTAANILLDKYGVTGIPAMEFTEAPRQPPNQGSGGRKG